MAFLDFHNIMNSNVGAISFNYSQYGCSITMAKTLRAISPKDIQKGAQVFDWQHASYFSISGHAEIMMVAEVLNHKLKEGVWPEFKFNTIQSTSQGQYAGLSITHFRDQQASRLTLANSTKSGGFLHLFYNFNSVNFNMEFSKIDTAILVKFLENYPTFLSALLANNKYDLILKATQKAANGNNNNGNYNNNYNNNYNSGYGDRNTGDYNNQFESNNASNFEQTNNNVSQQAFATGAGVDPQIAAAMGMTTTTAVDAQNIPATVDNIQNKSVSTAAAPPITPSTEIGGSLSKGKGMFF